MRKNKYGIDLTADSIELWLSSFKFVLHVFCVSTT